MKHLITIDDIDIKDKRVFVRTDYNVVEDGKIIDDFRIEASLPTLRMLLKSGCSLVLASHNGRPDGKPVPGLSLRPVAKRLAKLLGQDVIFVDDCVGEEVEATAKTLQPGQILLLENLRFYPQEEANSHVFAKQLADLADVYVDDAFANIHRAHASMVGIPKLLPHAAGLLLEKEYETLKGMMDRPKKPFVAIVGGAKISDKIVVLEKLIDKVDTLLLGGALANTFLYAAGFDTGKSMVEKNMKPTVAKILSYANQKGVNIALPVDVKVATKPDATTGIRNVPITAVHGDELMLDTGTKTAKLFADKIIAARQVFWNGTLGIAENPHFAGGSRSIAKAIKSPHIYSVIGGGDTAAFVDAHHMHDWYDWVSTGGGASLELIAGEKLPALEILMK